MRKLIGIFLLLLSLFMAYVGTSALVGTSDVQTAAAEAVWLGDNHCDPANEGKLVAAILSPEALEAAEDPELGVLFETPGVIRNVERFEHVGEHSYHWRSVKPENAGTDPASAVFMGAVKDPDTLQLDPAYGPMLPSGTDIVTLNLKNDNAEQLGLHSLWVLSRTYLTNTGYLTHEPIPDKEDDELFILYGDEVGKIRVHYRELWPDSQMLVFLGIQQGNALVPDPGLDIPAVSGDIESLEKLIKENRTTVIAGSVAMLAGALIVFLLGLIRLNAIRIPGKKNSQDSENL